MKKALIALVAIAVAIGFASTVFAADTTVKVDEKAKATKTGTKTTDKMTIKSGKQGHREKWIGKVVQVDAKGNFVTVLKYKDETLNDKNAEKMTLKLDPKLNHLKLGTHKGKAVVFSTYAVTPQTLATDRIIEGFELHPGK